MRDTRDPAARSRPFTERFLAKDISRQRETLRARVTIPPESQGFENNSGTQSSRPSGAMPALRSTLTRQTARVSSTEAVRALTVSARTEELPLTRPELHETRGTDVGVPPLPHEQPEAKRVVAFRWGAFLAATTIAARGYRVWSLETARAWRVRNALLRPGPRIVERYFDRSAFGRAAFGGAEVLRRVGSRERASAAATSDGFDCHAGLFELAARGVARRTRVAGLFDRRAPRRQRRRRSHPLELHPTGQGRPQGARCATERRRARATARRGVSSRGAGETAGRRRDQKPLSLIALGGTCPRSSTLGWLFRCCEMATLAAHRFVERDAVRFVGTEGLGEIALELMLLVR